MELDDILIARKHFTACSFIFPAQNGFIDLDVEVIDGSERLILTINRKGQIRLDRCSFLERHRNYSLIRLDLDKTKWHTNPNGQVIKGPHIHVYHRDYSDKLAYPIGEAPILFTQNQKLFQNIDDLLQTFLDFAIYCNIDTNIDIGGEFL